MLSRIENLFADTKKIIKLPLEFCTVKLQKNHITTNKNAQIALMAKLLLMSNYNIEIVVQFTKARKLQILIAK